MMFLKRSEICCRKGAELFNVQSFMKALLEKMEAKGDMPAYKEEASAAGEDLDHIFETHKLDKNGAHKDLYGELMDWKKHDY